MKRLPIILLLLVAVAFAAGLMHLFSLRFESGDIYPPYSSLRSDPLGTKAFYLGLGRFLPVQRNYQPRLNDTDSRQTTLFLLGLDDATAHFEKDDLKDLELFAAAGGRVIIALRPRFQPPTTPWYRLPPTVTSTNQSPARAGSKKKRPPRVRVDPGEEGAAEATTATLTERWKFQVEYGPIRRDEHDVYQSVSVQRQPNLALPESLDWHSGTWFKKLDPAWRVIYAREKEKAVMVERRFGQGSLLLMSDSYGFSNEALTHGQPDLLAWLAGASHRAIFDETHLGLTEAPGMATLARKHHLQGLFMALLGLAGLFIWQRGTAFMPPFDEPDHHQAADQVQGQDTQTGFVNLLRRNIAPSAVFEVCASEWRKSCARLVAKPRLEGAEAILTTEQALPPRSRDSLRAYCAVSRALARTAALRAS